VVAEIADAQRALVVDGDEQLDDRALDLTGAAGHQVITLRIPDHGRTS